MINYLLKLIRLLGHPQVSLPAQEVLLETTDPVQGQDSYGNDWLYLNDECGEFTTPLHPLQAALTQRLKPKHTSLGYCAFDLPRGNILEQLTTADGQ